MAPASGIQIAFLALAVEFFSMLLGRQVGRANGWPDDTIAFAGQLIAVVFGAVILFGVPSLRRLCVSALRKPIPGGMSLELLVVALAKSATPLAVIGAIVAWNLALGAPESLATQWHVVDPAQAWARTLSPAGLARTVLLSWFAGPIIEELVFRGFLYHAWERKWGWLPAMILTSACFGAAHPTHMASAFMGSIVYVCVLRRTGTLAAPIVVHVLYNMLVSWPFLGQLLNGLARGDPAALSTWWLPLASAAFVCVALPAYAWSARRGERAAGAFMPPLR